MLIVLTAGKVPSQGAPRERGGPARQRGAARRRPPADRLNLSVSKEDLDYQAFFREVPRDRFDEAVSESAGPEERYPRGFNFLDLDYPAGEQNPTSYRFDMGPADSPIAEGWTPITRSDLFTWEKGYGWSVDLPRDDFSYRGRQSLDTDKVFHYGIVQNQGVRNTFKRRKRPIDIPPIRVYGDPTGFYEEQLDDVTRDAVLDPENLAFTVALPNGRYWVSLAIGDLQIPRYGIDVYANGYLAASNVFTGRVMFRGYSEPAFPWPVRVAFPVQVVRNTLRIALRPNDNLFRERCEAMAETPDYNYSQLAFANRKPSKFFGKRMSTHGPATQMALASVVVSPHQNPPLELVRQKIVSDSDMQDKNALEGAALFNQGNYGAAESAFAKIPDASYVLKTHAYMALAGLLDTKLREEQQYIAEARRVLNKALLEHPDDFRAWDLARVLRYYAKALYLIEHAAEYDLSLVRAETGCLLSWVGQHDVLYSKKLTHYGRAFASMDPHRWTPSWHIAEEAFLELEQREPGNRFSGYYLSGNLKGWDLKDYQSDVADAPQWAVLMREGYNRLLDQIEWWGKNRQLPDGSLGGGWGDDVEIGLVWELVTLLNPDASPEAMETVRALAEGVWWGGEVDRDAGFFDGLADVEHTGEWTGDSQAVMIGLDYGNPVYYERALQTAKLMRDLWTDINRKGHRHFKSMVLGNKATGTRYGGVHDAEIDHPLNMRAAWPAFWAWWYCPTDELDRIFREWAQAWLEDTNRAENGKPAGIIPGPIGYHTDVLGGNHAGDWRRGAPRTNGYENPTYVQYVLDLFARMYRRTGETKWLAPRMAQISPDGKQIDLETGPTVGDMVADYVVGDWRALLIDQLDLPGNLKRIREAWPSLTSEVASTDRIAPPGLHELLHALLGQNFQGGLESAPFTLEKTSRNVAFLCPHSGQDRAKVLFYNFNDATERVNIRLWRLQVGATYRVKAANDADGDGEPEEALKEFDYLHEHRGDAIAFNVPARKPVLLSVVQTLPGKGVPERIIDLAMGPQDIRYENGRLHITVHNIGNLDCGPFTVNVKHAGRTLSQLNIDGLEAPNDLEPRRLTKVIPWDLPVRASLSAPARITVELDPDDRYYEITERNNIAVQGFPHETKPYMIPRAWPSLAKQHADEGYEKYQPVPGHNAQPKEGASVPNESFDIIEGWRVASLQDYSPKAADYDDSKWTVARISHSARSITPQAFARLKTPLWYRNTFALPMLGSDRRAFLEVNSACQAQVWINGRDVVPESSDMYHLLVDISDVVRRGDNTLVLRCVAPGIQGGIRIHVTGNQRLEARSLCVDTPDWRGGPAKVRLRAEAVNKSDKPFKGQLTARFFGPDHFQLAAASVPVSLAPGERKHVTLMTDPISQPPMWDIGNPRLCSVRVALEQNSETLYEQEATFGFKWCRFDPDKGLFLNGRRVQLRGVVFTIGPQKHDSREAEYAYEIGLLKEMGVNFVRFNPEIDHGLIRACDRAGILTTVPVHARVGKDVLVQTIRDDIQELFNSPSIIAWNFNGEGKGVDTANNYSFVAKMLREIDPTRSVLCVELGWRSSGTVGLIDTDVAGQGNYTGWYEGTLDHIGPYMDSYRQFLRKRYGRDIPIIISNYGAAADPNVHSDRPRRNDYSQEYHTAFHKRFYQEIEARPWIAGATMFCWRDVQTLQPIPRHTWKGVIDLNEGKRDAFHFYRSKWVDEPMVHIAQHDWSPRTVWPPQQGAVFQVYSNCDTVELKHNGESLGSRCSEDSLVWNIRLSQGRNILQALGRRGNVRVKQEAQIEVALTPPAPEVRLNRSKQFGDKLQLTWEPIPGVDGYMIECEDADETMGTPRRVFAVTHKTSLTFSPPLRPARYYVCAVADDVKGVCSEPVAWGPGLLRWRFANEGWLMASPAVADLDRDGRTEIIVGSYSGELFAVDASGQLLWSYKTREPGETIHSAPVVATLEPGADQSVVFTSSHALYALSSDGDLIWRRGGLPHIDRNHCSPTVGDLNGDGNVEIVVASDDGWVRAFRHTGKLLWDYSTDEGANRGLVHGTPVLFKESPDQDLMTLVGADSGRFYCLSAQGKLRWRTQRRLSNYFPGPVPSVDAAVGALEPGGSQRIVLASGHNAIYDAEGNIVKALTGLGGTAHVVDLFEDGRRQIVSARGRTLTAMKPNGDVLWQSQLENPHDFFSHHMSFADVNGDRIQDILVGTRATRLRVYSGSGEPLWHYTSDDELKAPPLVADLDADGVLEIIVCSRDGYLRVLGGGPDRGSRSQCLAFRGNLQRTGCFARTSAEEESTSFAGFVKDLYALENLPTLDYLPTRFVSSWDRTGANYDGHNEAQVQGDVYTIASLDGPGVIRRMSAAKPRGQLRIYLDGKRTPIIDMPAQAFFSGTKAPFLRPLVGEFGRGFYSYLPIPFRKSIRIEILRADDSQDAFGGYYHVTYNPLPAGTSIASLALPLSEDHQRALESAAERWQNLGEDPKTLPRTTRTGQVAKTVGPRQRSELCSLAGPAVIDALYLNLSSDDPQVLRNTLLQIYWDGQEKPAVECPVGDFFGNGFCRIPFETLAMGLAGDEYYCFFAMPFKHKARICLVNDSSDHASTVRLRVKHHRTGPMDGTTGYFHAKWRRQQVEAVDLQQSNLTGQYNYRILDVTGAGRYIGATLNVFNQNLFWWGEGDPMIFVDDDFWPPTIHGTGTEEHFNDAWGFHDAVPAGQEDPAVQRASAMPFAAVLLDGIEPQHYYGPTAVCGLHLADSIAFQERIQVTIEHGTENNLANDYASTAYWYATLGARDTFAMPAAATRLTSPPNTWLTQRDQALAEFTPVLRRQLEDEAAQVSAIPTNFSLHRRRIWVIRRVFKNGEYLGLSRELVREMSRMMNAARRRPMHERWEVMDIILTRLAAALPKREAHATATNTRRTLP
jgi:outer membrane protein assembly factor BamB